MKLSLCLLMPLFSIMSFTTMANVYNKKQLEQLAEEHAISIYPAQADEELQAFASPIDSRLNIQPCDTEVTAQVPNFNPYSKNMTVRIRCEGENGWGMYIPVQVKIMTPVIVAETYIESGQTITQQDLKVAMIEKNRSRNGFIADIKSIVGSKAKRQIRSGEAIISRNICFVCQGELVTIEAVSNNLSVKTTGIALSDGSYGDTVSVRNRSSNRVVQGRVSSVSEVQIFL
ncbi:flagellar biosynthesis [Catenovulum agarivorans DS-2]|uniref:Flagella basal body P-ring formation protein FlgA n=1 Tax=Catenovulum agarivorans DS-2 TaxID=1328313 RepID=W7QLW4_9ALTE|nr:flagellar basal body P-ring formation chaperone FlgA [Catenovulum agarivorans]EWH09942.1 flagellar biosynthesis [Catenovulum agarivorans DS-2]